MVVLNDDLFEEDEIGIFPYEDGLEGIDVKELVGEVLTPRNDGEVLLSLLTLDSIVFFLFLGIKVEGT